MVVYLTIRKGKELLKGVGWVKMHLNFIVVSSSSIAE